jgi:hypothetical protein
MLRSLSRLCVRAALALLLLTPTLAGAAPPAKSAPSKGKGKKGPSGPKNSALSNALSDKGSGIQKCAIDFALEKGANKVTVDVHVTINRTGAVVDRTIEVTADTGDTTKVKECVETLVNAAKFPAVPTPLATAQQSWTIAAQ